MTQPTATGKNRKSGAEVAQVGTRQRERTGAKGGGTGRDTSRYWEAKIFRRSWVDETGTTREVPEWRARMQLAGDRREVPLGTNEKAEAARKAARFFVTLRAKGWDAAFAEVAPDARPAARIERPTVGDWITAAEPVSQASRRTFAGYASSLRKIVADVAGLEDDDAARFDWRGGGREAWLAKVDGVRLDTLTPGKVEGWVASLVRAASGNPLAMQRARRNANSFVRQARALFSRPILKRIGLTAPAPLPFEGVELEPEGSTRYVATFDARRLMQDAHSELRASDPESWKAFLLLLRAGLRRGEADCLTWGQVDAKTGTVNIRTTDFFAPKSRTSERAIPLSPSITAELERFRSSARGLFVLESPHRPTPETRDRRYRAREIFARLVEWLRGKGVTADKPLHELRKEFGSIIAAQADLFTASRLLGHSNLDVTQRYYAEQRQRVTVDPMATTGTPSNIVAMKAA